MTRSLLFNIGSSLHIGTGVKLCRNVSCLRIDGVHRDVRTSESDVNGSHLPLPSMASAWRDHHVGAGQLRPSLISGEEGA